MSTTPIIPFMLPSGNDTELLALDKDWSEARKVVVSCKCSDQDVATLFALEDRITARRDTTAKWIKLKLLVTLRQIRTAYEDVSDSALWDRLTREIKSLG